MVGLISLRLRIGNSILVTVPISSRNLAESYSVLMRFYLYFRGPDVQKAGEISMEVLVIAREPPAACCQVPVLKGSIYPRPIILPRRIKYQPSPSAI
jgi:hypothetical protein